MAAFQYGEPRPTEHELWRREMDRKIRLAGVKRGLQMALDVVKDPDNTWVAEEKISALIAHVESQYDR